MKTKDDAAEPKAAEKPSVVDLVADLKKQLKAWARKEIHLAANGVNEAERETMNP